MCANGETLGGGGALPLITISDPTRLSGISYAVFGFEKKNIHNSFIPYTIYEYTAISCLYITT